MLAIVAVATVAGCVKDSTLAEALARQAKKYGVPGMTVVATRADRTIESVATGVRRAGQPDAVTTADRFHIGSNGKAMTATMIALLVEEGRLGWDTRLTDVFPEWKDTIAPAYREVTLTDLLLCRAGVPEFSNLSYLFTDDPTHRDDGSQHADEDRRDWQEMTSLRGTPTEQRDQFARQVLSREPQVTPRTKYLYSNASYGIAGAMAERAAGRSWETLMVTRLFEPLGIRATFDWPAADDANQPWGHFQERSGLRPHDPHGTYHLPPCIAPAGAISMSADDFAKFLQLHLQGLQGRDGLLRAATIKHLHARPPGADDREVPFAFGWALVAFEGGSSSWAQGSAGTFSSAAAIFPSRNLAVAVFANAGVKRTGTGEVELLKWAAGHYQAP